MKIMEKSRSPFTPGQPVSPDFFRGRQTQIQRIMQRGAGPVSRGAQLFYFVTGEYGIGKSSLAQYCQGRARDENNLHPVYVSLSRVRTIEDFAVSLVKAIVASGASDKNLLTEILSSFGKYVKEVKFASIIFRLDALTEDAGNYTDPYGILNLFREVHHRLGKSGLFVVLDEINGIAAHPSFAPILKGLIEINSFSAAPIPLLLMLCGAPERWREMLQVHPSVDRIFDYVIVNKLTDEEMTAFFTDTFSSVAMNVRPQAMKLFCQYSAGFPKIMHMIGDAAYWGTTDLVIDENAAYSAITSAASEIGNKYVNPQILDAVRSKNYLSLLSIISESALKTSPDERELSFNRTDVFNTLNDAEKKSYNNFITRMKQLNVVHEGAVRGTYVFNNIMVPLYVWLYRSAQELKIHQS